MDAKERLRRYLEQRREMGESELVLDGLPVDDVLSMLGAMRRGTPAAAARREVTPGREHIAEPTRETVVDIPPVAPTDWREALRESGAAEPATSPISATPAPRLAPIAAQSDVSTGAPSLDLGAADNAPAWLAQLGIILGLSAGRGTTASMDLSIAALPTLDDLADATRACTRCDLHRTATNAVPGEGDPNADFVCVGEAPGQNEDELGRPFVGAAGNLLNKILAAISLQREQVFICNVLKHRPPGNRDPLPDEVRACEPYLRRQLELVKPRVILALGRFAAQSLLQTATPIGKLRGAVHRYHGIPLIVTYHPAALLRNEAWKRPAWEDVKLARRILDASRATSDGSTAP